jgi:hypothetical protein
VIGTHSGAMCDVTWDIVRTLPRGAVLTIESFETWHWWKMQMNERKANIIPTRLIKIPIAIRQVFPTTRSCDASFFARSRSEFEMNVELLPGFWSTCDSGIFSYPHSS